MNLRKYLDELNTAYRKHREAWEKLQGQLAEVRAKQDELKSADASTLRKAADAEEYQHQAAEINSKLSDLQKAALADFESIESKYNDAIKKNFTVNAADVDDAAAMLINSGAMTDGDLYALANQFGDNVTMLKLIAGEAGKRESGSAKTLKTYIDNYINTTERKEIFDGALNNLYNALNPGRGLADPSANYWNRELYEKAGGEIAALDTFKIDAV